MIKKLILVVLILFPISKVHAIKLHTFSDLVNPLMFELDRNYIYIADKNSIYIYDIYNYKLIKTLLKKGSGPQEANNTPKVSLTDENITIFSDNRIFIYSKKFQFIREILTPLSTEIWKIIPIMENFVFPQYEERDRKLIEIYSLFNKNIVKIKKLAEVPSDLSSEIKYLISPYTVIASWKNKLFIGQPQKGFFIEVFDEYGNKLYKIEGKCNKIRAGEKHRQREQEKYLIALGKKKYDFLKAKGFFEKPLPKYLPDIKDIRVEEDRIYVQTYDIRGDKDKYFVLDKMGNILSTHWLPKIYVKKFTFYNKRFYYLHENKNGEGWELHMIELK